MYLDWPWFYGNDGLAALTEGKFASGKRRPDSFKILNHATPRHGGGTGQIFMVTACDNVRQVGAYLKEWRARMRCLPVARRAR